MSHEIRADYSQQWLLPPSLEDLLAADHPARFIREFVDALDLRQLGFKMRKGEEGRPNYAPDLLLKVWLYGYLRRIRSSRRLERACQEDIALMWLTGMHGPDHNSLWRFWKDNQKALKQVLRQTIGVAAKAGLVTMVLHAVDGTKITARASTDQMWGRKVLQERLARLDQRLEEMAAEVAKAERDEVGQEWRLPEELANKEKLRAEVRAKLAELAREDRQHMHPGERDAEVMKNHEGTRLGYNAQVVAESGHGLVVAADVTNEQNDLHQLVPMLEQVKQELGRVADETSADSGYWCGKQLAAAEAAHFPVLVSADAVARKEGAGGPYHCSQFSYDPERDCYTCPRGQVLTYEKSRPAPGGGAQTRVYRCRSYRQCPVRWQCSQDQGGRSVEQSPYAESVRRQREKQREAEKRELLRQRFGVVEPVFAVVKELLGFRRWTVGGLEKVRSQWWLVCAVVNLIRLYPLWRRSALQLT